SPFKLWFFRTDGEKLKRDEALYRISSAITSEIMRLLKEEGFRPSNIAIIVRRHNEAEFMKSILSNYRIPAVLESNQSVFDTKEAEEMEIILKAVSEPHELNLVRAALCTEMIGFSADELEALTGEEYKWDEIISMFNQLQELWIKRGFMGMFRQLMKLFHIRQRLLSFKDGKRRLTNLLHIVEILQKRASEGLYNKKLLMKWFSQQRDEYNRPSQRDEYQLRIESDEDAVEIVTIHKSKGLEYPVVFAPFTWDSSKIKHYNEPVTFHDREGRLVMAFSEEEVKSNKEIIEKERLAENTRLLYVALTRAKQLCYLILGYFNHSETSAPSYILHSNKTYEDFLKHPHI
ncbi:MAG: exodeoxyribonuclease V subunit beta, partial [Nitrospirae bacterium]